MCGTQDIFHLSLFLLDPSKFFSLRMASMRFLVFSFSLTWLRCHDKDVTNAGQFGAKDEPSSLYNLSSHTENIHKHCKLYIFRSIFAISVLFVFVLK